MSVLFVTGAGTDIGKTYATAALARGVRRTGGRVAVLKPLVSGVAPLSDPRFAESDTALLLRAADLAVNASNVNACSPWRFAAPLAPDMAAAGEGRAVSFREVAAWTRRAIARADSEALVLIEGVGGVMSPITADATVLDWIEALGAPALMVVGSYLGAISHALTALSALRARHVDVRAVLVNESVGSTVPVAAAAESVARFTRGTPIAVLRRDAELPASLIETLRADSIAELPA